MVFRSVCRVVPSQTKLFYFFSIYRNLFRLGTTRHTMNFNDNKYNFWFFFECSPGTYPAHPGTRALICGLFGWVIVSQANTKNHSLRISAPMWAQPLQFETLRQQLVECPLRFNPMPV